MPSANRFCCLLALVLVGAAAGPGVRSADPDDRDATVRSNGPLCTSTDSTAACLFKGLLKGVLLYTTSGRHDATAADKMSAEKHAGAAGGGTAVRPQSKGVEEFLMEQIQNVMSLFSFGFELPAEITAPWTFLKSSFLDGRGKKNKNLGPMLAAGVAVMAGTLLPLAFGALMMLAGKAIMTSLLALTISGMLGLKELMSGKHDGGGGGGGAHYKAYSPAAVPVPAHYSEAQFEQELGVYRDKTESKAHVAGGYYAGDSNLSAYYRGTSSAEQQVNGSDDLPEYHAGPKFHRLGDAAAAAAAAVDNNVVTGDGNFGANGNGVGKKILTDRVGQTAMRS